MHLCNFVPCYDTHTNTHTLTNPCTCEHMNLAQPSSLPPLFTRPPLVFDVVFREPCLKKFFSCFEVALCFPLSFCCVSSFIFWQCASWEGNRPAWNKILAPYTLFTVCCTCELEKFLEEKPLFLVRYGYTPCLFAKTLWSLSMKSSSLNKCLRSKVLMSFQAFIKCSSVREAPLSYVWYA